MNIFESKFPTIFGLKPDTFSFYIHTRNPEFVAFLMCVLFFIFQFGGTYRRQTIHSKQAKRTLVPNGEELTQYIFSHINLPIKYYGKRTLHNYGRNKLTTHLNNTNSIQCDFWQMNRFGQYHFFLMFSACYVFNSIGSTVCKIHDRLAAKQY